MQFCMGESCRMLAWAVGGVCYSHPFSGTTPHVTHLQLLLAKVATIVTPDTLLA